jgi:hypothetical protein
MEALETKKQLVLSGYTLDRCEDTVTEGNNYAAQLELSMPKGEDTRVSGSPEQVEMLRYKTSQSTWLSQVNNRWERVLYQSAFDWKNNVLPVEAKALLANGDDLERMTREGSWINFAALDINYGTSFLSVLPIHHCGCHCLCRGCSRNTETMFLVHSFLFLCLGFFSIPLEERTRQH